MGLRFAELDRQDTAFGQISLRRRIDPTVKTEVYEVKLGDEYLMSSLFTAAEVELARLGLAACSADKLDVLVGGLGLGYTAQAALDDDRVRSLTVVEAIGAVIDWHERGLVPVASALTADPRHRFVQGDFFALSDSVTGFDPDCPGRMFDAILLDIDHSPTHLLSPDNARFYSVGGLQRMARHLRPAGVFALWSNDPPDADFHNLLSQVFATVDDHVVSFDNPLQGRKSTNTVYTASNASAS